MQVKAVGKKTFEKSQSIHMQNSELFCETVVKIVGNIHWLPLKCCLHTSYLYSKVFQYLPQVKNLLMVINSCKYLDMMQLYCETVIRTISLQCKNMIQSWNSLKCRCNACIWWINPRCYTVSSSTHFFKYIILLSYCFPYLFIISKC